MPCSGYLALHGVNPNQKKKKIDIKRTPSKVDIEKFWSSIWAKSSTHNENPKWLKH